MDEPKKEDQVEKIKDVVTIDIEHELSDEEIKEIAMQLAQLYGEIEQAEERKKNVAAQHKNTIDGLKNQAKALSSHITTGFRTEQRVAELFLDYSIQKRMYYDKRTGDFLMEKSFLEDDYQKKINFFAKQEQIEYNNEIGNFAEGDPLDQVITDKKLSKKEQNAKEGAMIRNLQAPASKEFDQDSLPADDLFAKADEENLPPEEK